MTNFSMLLVNFTWILFPVLLFIVYETYSENINTKRNDLFLTFCLLTSLYLMIRCYNIYNNSYVMEITFDTVVLILYLKKQYKTALVTSILGIICLKVEFNHELIIIFKYVAYLVLYIIYHNKQKYYIIYTFISRMLCILSMITLKNIHSIELIEYLIYFLVTYLILLFLIKAEKILEVNKSYKELMHEHQLRESLFKISHEIKNPIAVCKGYLDMFDIKNTAHFDKYIPILKSEINKTLNLLQDFSACKKIKIEPEIIDISLLIEDITDNFKLMFDQQNINLKVDLIDEEIYINGDYNRLNQVLLNIIKNSMEAIDKNKKSYIKISNEIIKNQLKIYIEDNGVGISEENLKKIKEPFFTTKQNGTGLGVVLSEEIIVAHHGKIEYLSQEGKGTKVIITLPIKAL